MMTTIVTATRTDAATTAITDAVTMIVMMMKMNEVLIMDAWTFILIYADG